MGLGFNRKKMIPKITHFPPEERKDLFKFYTYILQKGGIILFEGFGQKHPEYQKTNPESGGKGRENGFLKDELRESFEDLVFLEFYEGEVELE